MSLRHLPGALILGLLASLAAHTAAFGSGHTEGGAYHALVTTLALAGAGGALLAALTAAFGTGGTCAQGSVLAARLSTWIPNAPLVAVSGTAWFALIESTEPSHAAASILAIAAGMLVAALALRTGAIFVARIISECALAIAKAVSEQLNIFIVRRYLAPAVVTPHLARRIVTRPPPRFVR